jgi:hypothetical protein
MVINVPRIEIQFLDSFGDSFDREMANDKVCFAFRKNTSIPYLLPNTSLFNLIVVYLYIEFHQLNGIVFQINIVREFIQTECMKWPDLNVHSWPPNDVFKNRMQSDGYNCIHLFFIYYCLYIDTF